MSARRRDDARLRGLPEREALWQSLQRALEVEHYSIPLYLFALYSLREGSNPEAANVLRSIVREEMLHLALLGNVLNAVGGAPDLLRPGFNPRYPAPLPGGALRFGLRPFSRETVQGLALFESNAGGIGTALRALQSQLRALCERYGEEALFTGDPALQLTPHEYHSGGGEVLVVHDLPSALAALDTILEQGEGTGGGVDDGNAERFEESAGVAHYFHLQELLLGRRFAPGDTPAAGPTGALLEVDWSAAWPVQEEPGATEDPEVRALVDGCARRYEEVLEGLHRTMNGEREAMQSVIAAMFKLRYEAAALMRLPTERGDATVGPRFWR